jgi:hypothetical protein
MPLAAQEVASGIRAVDFEALMLAAVRGRQAHVVEHRPGIEKFNIELQATPLSGQRAPVIDAAGVVKKQR